MFLVPLKVTVPPVLLDPPHANAAIRTAPHAAAQRSDLPVLDITATSLCAASDLSGQPGPEWHKTLQAARYSPFSIGLNLAYCPTINRPAGSAGDLTEL